MRREVEGLEPTLESSKPGRRRLIAEYIEIQEEGETIPMPARSKETSDEEPCGSTTAPQNAEKQNENSREGGGVGDPISVFQNL